MTGISRRSIGSFRVAARTEPKWRGEWRKLIGDLTWQVDPQKFAFGEARNLYAASRSIRTFTEQVEDTTELNSMRLLVSNAARIVFLGFGFHKQNMELLAPKKLDANKHVFATAFEAPTGEGRRIRDALGARFNFYGQSTVEDDTCDDFASSYVRYLASG